MGEKTKAATSGINGVLADNLRRLIHARKTTQKQLEAKSGIAQSTISLYLNPEQRQRGASGKEPSAKIAEVARLAGALEVQAWELLKPSADNDLASRVQALPPEQRKLLDSLIEAFVSGVRKGGAPDLTAAPSPTSRQPGQFIVAELKLINDPSLALQAEYRAIDAVAKFLHPDRQDGPGGDDDGKPTPRSPAPAPSGRARRTTRKPAGTG